MRTTIIRWAIVLAPRAAVTMTGAGYAVDYESTFHDLRGTLPERTDVRYSHRNVSSIQGLVIHHSATKGQSIRSMAQFHTQTRGWPAIAYHFAIGWDGKVYQLNDVDRLTYHAQGHNARTIGVVIIGNYEDQQLSLPAEAALMNLAYYLKDEYHLRYMWLHRQVRSTACPGAHVVELITPYLYGLEYLPQNR